MTPAEKAVLSEYRVPVAQYVQALAQTFLRVRKSEQAHPIAPSS